MNNPQACRAQNCWNTASMWWSSSAVNRRFSRVTMYCWIIWWCWQIKNKTQTFSVFIHIRTSRGVKACKNHRPILFINIIKHISTFPQDQSHWQEQHKATLTARKKHVPKSCLEDEHGAPFSSSLLDLEWRAGYHTTRLTYPGRTTTLAFPLRPPGKQSAQRGIIPPCHSSTHLLLTQVYFSITITFIQPPVLLIWWNMEPRIWKRFLTDTYTSF